MFGPPNKSTAVGAPGAFVKRTQQAHSGEEGGVVNAQRLGRMPTSWKERGQFCKVTAPWHSFAYSSFSSFLLSFEAHLSKLSSTEVCAICKLSQCRHASIDIVRQFAGALTIGGSSAKGTCDLFILFWPLPAKP